MQKNLPIVALVGPPNAGKSTLLNKIAKEHLAITSLLAGTTRDRQYVRTSFAGADFILVDTAGLDLTTKGELEENVQKQIDIALKEADCIILVADGKQPAGAIDQKVLTKFRKIKKPKILAVNKLDSPTKRGANVLAFSRLGIKPMFPISSITGAGIGDMLESIADIIQSLPLPALPTTHNPLPTISVSIVGKPASAAESNKNISIINKEKIYGNQANESIKVAVVGKPNVGKSSLFNKLLNDERAVVSSLPGTTRTSVDDEIIINGVNYTFIDTAGLKKKEHKQTQPDVFSGFQTFKSIRKSDVCFLVLDATEDITVQDKRIAQEILQMQKGCVIIANKIDLYKGKENALKDYISHHFPFLWMCPVFFVSALTGKGINDSLKAIKPIYERRNKKIDNEILSEFLTRIIKRHPPKRLWDQKNPKVFSISQLNVNPPTFDLLVNFPAAIAHHFKHYLENAIIRDLDFYGTPIKLHLTRKIGR